MKDFYFSNEDDEKDFLKNKKWLIHSLIIDGVKKSFEENLDSIVVFRIINPISNFVMTSEIKREDWLDSLSKSMEYYESVEEYEKCTEIKELIKNIKDDFDRSDKGEE
jgi:archaellum biogenesis protein FlaJ (TadC family)